MGSLGKRAQANLLGGGGIEAFLMTFFLYTDTYHLLAQEWRGQGQQEDQGLSAGPLPGLSRQAFVPHSQRLVASYSLGQSFRKLLDM